MLQKIHDKITGIVAIIFLGLIAVVFVFWGIDFQSSAGNFAAKVNGERISVESVNRAWQQRQSQLQQMFRGELPEEMAKAQQSALLDQFVRQELLTQRAKQLGYRVSDEALHKRIMEFPEFQVDGKFSPDRYRVLVRQSGASEASFEADLQTEVLITQIQSGIVDSAFIAPYELERRYALDKQERDVDYAMIASSDFLPNINPTDEQLQAWYEAHKSEFMTTETVDLHFVELARDKAEATVQVSEEALKEYYEQVKDRFQAQERRRARHILIQVGEGLDDAAAQKKAQELTDKAKSGADFAQLAKDNSKDPGSAQQGGDLGWAERGVYVGPFEDTLFAMSPGEIRGPIKTQFGYHVIRLEEVEAGQVRSFEEARAELEAEYRAERAQTVFYDQTQQLADQAFSALTELDTVASSLGLTVKTIPGFTRQGGGELGQDPAVIEAAFSEDVLERGQNSPLVTLGEDRALVLRISNHKPSVPRTLAEVREQVVSRVKSEEARKAAEKKGSDALARLEKGESWSAVTADSGLKPIGTRVVTREDTVVPPAVLRAAFSAPSTQVSAEKPHFAGTFTDDGNYVVLSVSGVRAGDPAKETATEKNTRRLFIERQVGNEEFAAYVMDAERDADIVKNDKVFE
jgi:peptidyl-prolyl cis-trans isomerase D